MNNTSSSQISKTPSEKSSDTPKLSYPKAPKPNPELRNSNKAITLVSNLYTLDFKNSLRMIQVYSITINPGIEDNFPLFNKIMKSIDEPLSTVFPIKMIAGFNMFAISKENEYKKSTEVENIKYDIIIKKVSIFDFQSIIDLEGINLKKKQFIEKLIKNILLSSKDTIRFGDDRTVVKMTKENQNQIGRGNESIYKGFYTSAQITVNGLYLLVLNVNKYISGKTVLEKIKKIREDNQRDSEQDIREKIEEYISTHRTVLATYGSYRAYRIEGITFDRTPSNTSININTKEGKRTITLSNYYSNQYRVKIKDLNQPLLIAETDKKTKKLLLLGDNKENKKNEDKNEDRIIYLVPELLFTTGLDMDKNGLNSRRDIISKTKANPSQRMAEISKIKELYNSTENKVYKKKDGSEIRNKSSKEIADEWGINLGENLTLDGREIPQPTLNFDKSSLTTRNGLYRSQNILKPVTYTKDNLIYIYDRNDRSDFKFILNGLLNKARQKGINVNCNANDIRGYGISKTHSWNEIKNCLIDFHLYGKRIEMAIVFTGRVLEKYYHNLKNYLVNEIKIESQFTDPRKLTDPKRAGSIMFNLVEQINVKMGGQNFYIDFIRENIIQNDKIYLIMGLEVKPAPKNKVDYILTCAINPKLNKVVTIPITCNNVKEDKQNTISKLMEQALHVLREVGKANHPPDHIIIYRQGGNQVQNQKILLEEVPMFVKHLNQLKEKNSNYKRMKLMYICCNLKSDLKFFETEKKNNYETNQIYKNPASGLCVDATVIKKDKFEFYIQPQYVNQGTATPCHYEVIYQELDKNNPNNNIKLENLEKLSFYLSFYYPTWSGAVRVPGVLKLSSTASDFYSRCLDHKLVASYFDKPSYI